MPIRIHHLRILLLGSIMLLACTLGMSPRPPATEQLWEQVAPPKAPSQDDAAQRPWIIRQQTIRLRHPALDILRDRAHTHPAGIVLNLTNDSSYEMTIDSKTPGALSTIIIKGHLKNADRSDVILVIKEQNMAGTIHLDQRVFTIQSVEHDEHLLTEIDPEKLPPD